jgi:formamidopyrimidine-DNA glycosylase
MPELPEVEIFKNHFNSKALQQEIAKVEVKDAAVLGISEFKLKSNSRNRNFRKPSESGRIC